MSSLSFEVHEGGGLGSVLICPDMPLSCWTLEEGEEKKREKSWWVN